MRLANLDGRLAIVGPDGTAVDVAAASQDRFSSDPMEVLERWDDFRAWADGAALVYDLAVDPATLGPIVPRPRQVFGVGLNYRTHAVEVGWNLPEVPLTFTKFPSSIAGPGAEVGVTGPRVDWEVEVVVVLGRDAWKVGRDDAWDYVAGVTVGQDISDRDRQNRPVERPSFSLGKSCPGFAPVAGELLTVDEVDRECIEIGCSLNGEVIQHGATDDLIFDIPALIEFLSDNVQVLAGDLIFTGTPSGVGALRKPPRYLGAGDVLRSWMTGGIEMEQTFR